jgi:hypothetical protein
MKAPKFLKVLDCIYASAGESITFECQVEGNPRPTITWFKQSSIIKANEEIQIFYDEDNTAKLIIKEVFPDDAGTYIVVAKNVMGSVSYSAELVVEGIHNLNSFYTLFNTYKNLIH